MTAANSPCLQKHAADTDCWRSLLLTRWAAHCWRCVPAIPPAAAQALGPVPLIGRQVRSAAKHLGARTHAGAAAAAHDGTFIGWGSAHSCTVCLQWRMHGRHAQASCTHAVRGLSSRRRGACWRRRAPRHTLTSSLFVVLTCPSFKGPCPAEAAGVAAAGRAGLRHDRWRAHPGPG
jgi:hypothetical protein